MADLAQRPTSRPSPRRWLGTIGSVLWYRLWWNICRLVCVLAFGLKVEGRQHEPRRGPYIAVFNHASAIDTVLSGLALQRQAAYMAKSELFGVPILGRWIASLGAFPVRRGEPDRKALRHALHVLEQGGVLIMFPEGTRSPDGRLRSAEPGAALLALRTGAPVLPVALIGSHRVLPKGSRFPRLVRVRIRIGPPLAVPRIEGKLDSDLLDRWGQRFIAEIGKLLPPDQGGTLGAEVRERSPAG